MSIVSGVVIELQTQGLSHVLAHRRWTDPEPGSSVIVVTSENAWTHGPSSAEYPLVRAVIYSAPTARQADAETVGEPVAAAVRRSLHVLDGRVRYWGDQRVISSQQVGSALYQVEGHPDWRVRALTFEIETA